MKTVEILKEMKEELCFNKIQENTFDEAIKAVTIMKYQALINKKVKQIYKETGETWRELVLEKIEIYEKNIIAILMDEARNYKIELDLNNF